MVKENLLQDVNALGFISLAEEMAIKLEESLHCCLEEKTEARAVFR